MPMADRAHALAVLGLAGAVNLLHNQGWRLLPDLPWFYPLLFFVGVGTVLPALVLGRTARRVPHAAADLGLAPGRRDGVACVVALLVGGALAAAPLAPIVGQPGGVARVFGLFCQLLVASTAEVALFLGVMGVLLLPASGRRTRWHGAALVVVSSVAFGLFHFTYPAPWNTPATAITVGLVWLLVSTCFVLGRSLVAAVLLDNVMATVGFATRGLSLPMPPATALALAALAAVAFVVAYRWARRAPDATWAGPSRGTTG